MADLVCQTSLAESSVGQLETSNLRRRHWLIPTPETHFTQGHCGVLKAICLLQTQQLDLSLAWICSNCTCWGCNARWLSSCLHAHSWGVQSSPKSIPIGNSIKYTCRNFRSYSISPAIVPLSERQWRKVRFLDVLPATEGIHMPATPSERQQACYCA